MSVDTHVHRRTGPLRTALAVICVVLVVEIIGGLAAHSLALLFDAGHMLTDLFAIGLAWFALAQSHRPADSRRTYGYHRVGILAALANATVLVLIVAGIVFDAVRRLQHPEPVQGGIVVAVALAAVAANGFVTVRLRPERQDL